MKSKRLNMASIVGATNTQDTDENRYEQPIYGKYNLILLRLLFMFAPNSMDTKSFRVPSKKKNVPQSIQICQAVRCGCVWATKREKLKLLF